MTKYFVTRVKISPRKTIESINCGNSADETIKTVESLWGQDYEGAKVTAIRELTAEEIEAVNNGNKVTF